MKIFFITLLLLFSMCSIAQQVATIKRDTSLLRTIDTLKMSQVKVDSIKQKLNYDSLKEKINQPLSKVDSLERKLKALQPDLTLPRGQSITIPHADLLSKSKDSLNNQLNGIKQKASLEKIAQPQLKAEESVKKAEGKVNEKLKMFSDKGGNVGPVNVTSISGNSGINNPLEQVGNSSSIDLPGANSNIDMNTNTDTDTGSLNGKLDVLTNNKVSVQGKKLNDLTQGGAIKNAQEKIGDLSKASEKVSGYSKDAKNIAHGNMNDLKELPDELEKKVANLDEVKELEKEIAPANEYMDMVAKWNSDPQYRKELAMQKAKEQVVNHFQGRDKELLAAIDKLSAAKTKARGLKQVINAFDKQPNPLKEKTFRERVIPGINLQIQGSRNWWLDVNPYAGYLITERFVAGLGWNERISYSFKKWQLVNGERIYGPRLYVEFKLKENFILKAESEWMNTWISNPYPAYQVDINSRLWIWTPSAGIKNTFKFSKKVTGHVQLLYTLYNPEKLSPYLNRLNVRLGFELPITKKTNDNTD